MENIESFRINHLVLEPGLYVSRKDKNNDAVITTFDMRLTAPNREPVVDMPALHTIEHLGATYLRNSTIKEKIVYFGPMGCRTGCYLLMFGDLKPQDILAEIIAMCDYILSFKGEIHGARPEQCGNYLEQNLEMAKYYIRKYKNSLLHGDCFEYKE